MDIDEMMWQAINLIEEWMTHESPPTSKGYVHVDESLPFLFCRPHPVSNGSPHSESNLVIPEVNFHYDDYVTIFRGTPKQYAARGHGLPSEIITNAPTINFLKLAADTVEQWMRDGYPCCRAYTNFEIDTRKDGYEDGSGLYPQTSSIGYSTNVNWEVITYQVDFIGFLARGSMPEFNFIPPDVAQMPFLPDHSMTTNCICTLGEDTHSHFPINHVII